MTTSPNRRRSSCCRATASDSPPSTSVGESLRFVWDANFGGELDIVDYGAGRSSRSSPTTRRCSARSSVHFDPNQGNYILSGSASLRTRGVEVAGVFYHQSRHLADRAKRVAVDWNMVGARVERSVTTGRRDVDGRVRRARRRRQSLRGLHVGDRRGRAQRTCRFGHGWRALRPARCAVSAWTARRIAGTRPGFAVKAACVSTGRRAAMEFFLAAEQRIDPYAAAVRDRDDG